MLPLRLVLDTNIIVSAAPKPESLQRTTLLLAISKPASLYISKPILEEYSDVLTRPELAIRKGLRLQILQLIKKQQPSHRSQPSSRNNQRSRRQYLSRMRRRGESRLSDYGQSETFSVYWKSTKIITSREFIGLAPPHPIR